ncbi:MAG TPA: TIR domain-containing protein [Thermoanaerobaculia bacterium]|jgi:hypothetical protein
MYDYAAFISYSHRDMAWVHALHNNLENCLRHYQASPGQIFLDSLDLTTGTSWISGLEQSLERSKYLILIITPDAVASPRIEDEWQAVVDRFPDWKRKGRVLPVELAWAPLPPFLKPVQRLDFKSSERSHYLLALKKLLGNLLGMSQRDLPELPEGIIVPEWPRPSLSEEVRGGLVKTLAPRLRSRLDRRAILSVLGLDTEDLLEGYPSPELAASALLVHLRSEDERAAAGRLIDILVRELEGDPKGVANFQRLRDLLAAENEPVGPGTGRIPPTQTKGSMSWESRDMALLKYYFETCASYDKLFEPLADLDNERTREYFLASGLAVLAENGAVLLTQDGVLLCCKRALLPRAELHVHVKVQSSIETDKITAELWGSVLYLYREILNLLSPLMERRLSTSVVRSDQGSEAVFYEYPRNSLIEAVVNFLIHRDYSVDDLGRIRVFPDRIELTNPGQSVIEPGILLAAREPLDPIYVRNRRLVEAMSKARFNQREGGGILAIRRALEDNGSYRADGSLGLSIENDKERNRFTLKIFRRMLDTPIARSTPGYAHSFQTAGALPAGSPTFVGREEEMGYIRARLKRSNLLIVGARRIGKTSLLNQVYHWAQGQKDLEPIFLDLQGTASSSDFLRALSYQGDDETLAASTRESLRGFSHDPARALQSLAETTNRNARLLVLFLNEIDSLAKDASLFSILRSLSDQGLARFVMTGYSVVDRLNDPTTPFFHFTEGDRFGSKAICLGAISEPAARSLLNLLEADGPRSWVSTAEKEQAYALLISRSYRIPWVLQRFCRLLVEHADLNERDQWGLADVQAVVGKEGAVLLHVLEGIDYPSLGSFPLRESMVARAGMQLILLSLARKLYFKNKKAPIGELLQERPMSLSFDSSDARKAFLDTLDGLLVGNEEKLAEAWIASLDLELVLRRLVLAMMLEPDSEKQGRYAFFMNIFPTELHRAYGEIDPDLDDQIVAMATELAYYLREQGEATP